MQNEKKTEFSHDINMYEDGKENKEKHDSDSLSSDSAEEVNKHRNVKTSESNIVWKCSTSHAKDVSNIHT